MHPAMTSGLLMGDIRPTSFYVGGFVTGADQTTYTFGSTPLGAKDVNGKRWTVVCAGSYSGSLNRSVSAVTVGGSPATIVSAPAASVATCAIAIIDTSAMADTVAVTFTLTIGGIGAGMVVYRMFDILSSTPFSTSTGVHVAGLVDLSTDVNTPGCTVGVVMTQNGGTSTWTGLSEDGDSDTDTDDYFSVASGGAAGFPSTIRVQCADTTPGDMRACVASWR